MKRLLLKQNIIGFIIACCCFTSTLQCLGAETPRKLKVAQSWEIDEVISAFPVGFYFITTNNMQFIAYYDKEHNMKVAARKLDSERWSYKILPTKIGWDSHNYITMAFDKEGFLHLSGNMHCVPLIYFRSSKPWDISTLERIPSMCGTNENRCTYPKFMDSPDGELIFHYRDGSSGNGQEIYNIYDLATKEWRRLLDKPLIDGEGAMNAYMLGPQVGADGYYYLCWVWRDTHLCETNHDLSIARSRDLINWENLFGQPLELPITIRSPGTIIDPVPVKGGIINGCQSLAFDSEKRPVVTYHKFDENGNTQVYAARFENNTWNIKQLTDWTYRWYFKGGGTMNKDVHIGRLQNHEPGKLSLPYSHKKHGGGLLIIDEKTLAAEVGKRPPNPWPSAIRKKQSKFPGIRVKIGSDRGGYDNSEVQYVIRWETINSNRDRKPPEPHPEPSKLVLYKLMTDS